MGTTRSVSNWAIRVAEVWIFLLLSVAVYPRGSEAAGFACAQASAQVEKLICGDPDLSNLDEKLSKLYSAARQMRQGDDVLALIKAQRVWNAQRAVHCSIDGVLNSSNSKVECLKEFYINRIDEIFYYTQAQPRVKDTEYYPLFWGIKLSQEFPQLLWQSQNNNIRSKINAVFKDDSGEIVFRITVPQKIKDSADFSYKGYYVFPFRKEIIEIQGTKNYEFDFDDVIDFSQKWEKIFQEPRDSVRRITQKNRYVIYNGQSSGDKCSLFSTPLRMSDNIQPEIQFNAYFALRRNYAAGVEVDKAGCDTKGPARKVTTLIGGVLPEFVPLADGTFLAWPSASTGGIDDIVRLDKHLHTTYQSERLVILNDWQRAALPEQDGFDAVQKFLVSLFPILRSDNK